MQGDSKHLFRRVLLLLVALALTCGVGLWSVLRIPDPDRPILPFPESKSCAISITDDTDFFQFRTAKPIYDLLNRHGGRVTKTVWVFDDPERSPDRVGLSLENRVYRNWVEEQHLFGHEITLHSASAGDDPRSRTFAAYDSLQALFGSLPRLDIFHSNNKEAFYWGRDRLPNGLLRSLYSWRMEGKFEGADPNSPFYWVDKSRELIDYVRTYTFNEIDSWAVNPSMPYEDPATPQAPLWFASSNGRSGADFVKLCQPAHLEELKRRNGVSVVYVHFGWHFDNQAAMETLARCAGDPAIELVPAGEVLDRLRLIQLVRGAIEQGQTRWLLPRRLEPAVRNLSVQPHELGDAYGLEAGELPQRMSLLDWAARAGVELEWNDRTVFEGAVQIPWREKWRLIGHWLLTQVRSPT